MKEIIYKQAMENIQTPENIEERILRSVRRKGARRQVAMGMPAQKRSGAKRVWKTAAGTVSALAAAFVLLLGVNGLNPALAESLPLIGGIFRQINNTQGWLNLDATQSEVQRYAVPVEGVEVQVPAGEPTEKPMTMAVKEVYYDGEFLYAGLTMEIDSDAELYTFLHPGYDILINGDGMMGYNEQGGRGYDTDGFALMSGSGDWQRGENGTYISQLAMRVPERYHESEQLNITLQFDGIAIEQEGPVSYANSTPFDLSFTAERNGVQRKRIEGGLEVNGVKLISAAATPAGTVYTVDFSDRYVHPGNLGSTAAHGPQFEDGCALGGMAGRVVPKMLENGMTRETCVFGGLQEKEDRKVVYTVYDKNGSHDYEAVFILDFQNGTAEIGTADDVVEFTPSSYVCPKEELEKFSGRHKLSYVCHRYTGNELAIFVDTKDTSPRPVGVEIWQEGELIGVETDRTVEADFPWDRQRYVFYPRGMEILNDSKPVTIKLYDASNGKKMLEETVTLTPGDDFTD